MKAINYGELVLRKSRTDTKSTSTIWINDSRIIASFAVVFFHVTMSALVRVQDMDSPAWWVGTFYYALCRGSVPVFIMLSGLLLLDTGKMENLTTFYKKRANKLLIPLIFWTLFYTIFSYFMVPQITGESASVSYLFKMIIMGTPYYHLWYLYMIIGIYLLTPFLRNVIMFSSYRELSFLCIFLFAFVMAYSIMNSYFSTPNLSAFFKFILYLPYFLAGFLIYKAKINPNPFLLGGIIVLSMTITISGDYFFAKFGLPMTEYFNDLFSITQVAKSLSVMFLLKRLSFPLISNKINSRLAILCFGVFLIHPAFIDIFRYSGIRVTTNNLAYAAPLIAITIFCLSAIAALIISRVPFLKKVI